jgi:hypothetical protein
MEADTTFFLFEEVPKGNLANVSTASTGISKCVAMQTERITIQAVRTIHVLCTCLCAMRS